MRAEARPLLPGRRRLPRRPFAVVAASASGAPSTTSTSENRSWHLVSTTGLGAGFYQVSLGQGTAMPGQRTDAVPDEDLVRRDESQPRAGVHARERDDLVQLDARNHADAVALLVQHASHLGGAGDVQPAAPPVGVGPDVEHERVASGRIDAGADPAGPRAGRRQPQVIDERAAVALLHDQAAAPVGEPLADERLGGRQQRWKTLPLVGRQPAHVDLGRRRRCRNGLASTQPGCVCELGSVHVEALGLADTTGTRPAHIDWHPSQDGIVASRAADRVAGRVPAAPWPGRVE